jgi:hypothetical protein
MGTPPQVWTPTQAFNNLNIATGEPVTPIPVEELPARMYEIRDFLSSFEANTLPYNYEPHGLEEAYQFSQVSPSRAARVDSWTNSGNFMATLIAWACYENSSTIAQAFRRMKPLDRRAITFQYRIKNRFVETMADFEDSGDVEEAIEQFQRLEQAIAADVELRLHETREDQIRHCNALLNIMVVEILCKLVDNAASNVPLTEIIFGDREAEPLFITAVDRLVDEASREARQALQADLTRVLVFLRDHSAPVYLRALQNAWGGPL